jgi:zinc finger-containing ubiquitin peptidase 1
MQKSELGPHAHENQMPNWLVKVLESDGEIRSVTRLSPEGKLKKFKVSANHAAGVLPVLKQLLNQDPYTQFAYLCHPSVKHVSKLRREGKLYTFMGSNYLADGPEVVSVAIEIFKW